MPEANFVSAILPLLQNSEIDVLEWSFDTAFNTEKEAWLTDLLNHYSANNRLIGHGVYYSVLDAVWTNRQEIWLKKIKEEISLRNYNHITEHFGFMSSDNSHQGVPLPLSLNKNTLAIGKDRIQRLQDVVEVPVGLENLAFSFSKEDVKEQGEFLSQLIEDVNGFIILDLHNLYCQSHNFEIDILELINLYPLEKVREIHLSGGSWEESIYAKKPIRRDTHDDEIPEILFQILPAVLEQCRNVEYVIIERMGNSFDDESKINYQNDFRRVKQIINKVNFHPLKNSNWKKRDLILGKPLQDPLLLEDQKKLVKLLSEGFEDEFIKNEKFNYYNPQHWNLDMINTAKQIIEKWSQY